MHHITLRMLALSGTLLLSSLALAAPEGHFKGKVAGQRASADLELLDTSLVGILVVGDDRYLINASLEGETFNGSASDMVNGRQLPLNIHAKRDGIFVRLNAGTSAATSIEMLQAR